MFMVQEKFEGVMIIKRITWICEIYHEIDHCRYWRNSKDVCICIGVVRCRWLYSYCGLQEAMSRWENPGKWSAWTYETSSGEVES